MDNKKIKVAIKTFGCQMNMYDTEVAHGLLSDKGYQIFHEHEMQGGNAARPKLLGGEREADVILMNTCSVREHAEERVFGRLGMLGRAKQRNPELIVGLMGCMVEEHKEKLFKRFPALDLMVGTRNIAELPDLIESVRKNRQQVARIKQDGISIEYTDFIKRQGKYHAWLPIMTGCNKVCTFCIVPITRGSEVSMKARDVYRETQRLVDEGVKWITLLGQNVNSYNGASSEDGKSISFSELLDQLCQIEGLEMISFTTSHPHDATEELFQVIAKNPKISRRFHLPLQSGSDAMLKRMKRLHTFEEYKQQLDRLRELVPDICITTDIIVGFSGESEEDHQATRRALEDVGYDGAFIYKYSVRPGTPAAKLEDDVPLEVKDARNKELLDIQKKISEQKNQEWLGKTVSVFAEKVSAKDSQSLVGRTSADKKVVFQGSENLIGSFHEVKIMELRNETFSGQLV